MENDFVVTAINKDVEPFYFDNWDELSEWLEENELEQNEVKIEVVNFGDDDLFVEFYDPEVGNFEEVYDFLDNLDPDEDSEERIGVRYLLENNGCGFDYIRDHYDEVRVHYGDAESYAEEMIDDGVMGDIPDNIRPYIDCEAFARDLLYGGDIVEFEYYIITNPLDF